MCDYSLIVICMEIVSVLLFFDGSLDLVEGLFDERAILNVEDTISIALDLWVMSNHDTCCCTVLTFTLRSNPVDIKNQVHDCNYKKQSRLG